jgi:hypothetical protein
MSLIGDIIQGLKALSAERHRVEDLEMAQRSKLGELLGRISDCLDEIVQEAIREGGMPRRQIYEFIYYCGHVGDLVGGTLQPSTAEEIKRLLWEAQAGDALFVGPELAEELFGIQLPAERTPSRGFGPRAFTTDSLGSVERASGEFRALSTLLKAEV